jgi:hypothetical protein
MSAEEYAREEYQFRIRAPESCPNCQSAFCLEALGYYSRNVSALDAFKALLIFVRRFRCRDCCISVSLLPSFCQPYHLLRTETIEGYFSDEAPRKDEMYWDELLYSYKHRFLRWLPELSLIIGNRFGEAPSIRDPLLWWRHIIKNCGCLKAATYQIVKTFKVCPLGRYRCHQRRDNVALFHGTKG